ncbi:hypothetical protein NL676_027719 [Syzygium grande]|nr:hypothetical protein NL676_027719 [Syzygium grande]
MIGSCDEAIAVSSKVAELTELFCCHVPRAPPPFGCSVWHHSLVDPAGSPSARLSSFGCNPLRSLSSS